MADPKLTTIWKFPLSLVERQTVKMPVGSVLLHFGFDSGRIRPAMCIWAAVDADEPKVEVEVILVGTGNPLPHVGTYIGTIVDGSFVWHLFTGPKHALKREMSFHYLTKGGAA